MQLRPDVQAAHISAHLSLHVRRNHHSGETDVIKDPEKLIETLHEQIAALRSENNTQAERIEELEDAKRDFGPSVTRLHDAICEGRRQEAVDILKEVTGQDFRSVAQQHNLFPGRVPA
jgi:hypothetical protein